MKCNSCLEKVLEWRCEGQGESRLHHNSHTKKLVSTLASSLNGCPGRNKTCPGNSPLLFPMV
ncbi:hypothetical protein E2C01_010361 [Portunus trituberculatus]|uniref:Uncharacterized protein n=1 Tax=Portunus trituberculatus TaxID=210409 RepID=A0A5B7D8H0_PORTR|nr:hypothetical protein [Portunus trituberculatus]